MYRPDQLRVDAALCRPRARNDAATDQPEFDDIGLLWSGDLTSGARSA